MLDGEFTLGTTFPHVYVGVPVSSSAPAVPWNIDAASLQTLLSIDPNFGAVTISRMAYTPTGHNRWSGGYRWTVTFTERDGDIPLMSTVNSLSSVSTIASQVIVETGGQGSPAILDDPGTAVNGNQVGGAWGISFTDSTGRIYPNSSSTFMPVVNASGQALTAAEFQAKLVTFLDNQEIVEVTRSTTFNKVMGYKYFVKFTGQVVGGNVMSLIPITTSLTVTSIADTTKQVGQLCSDSRRCAIGSYVVLRDVEVLESTPGAQLQGSFQLVFNGYTTGAIAYNAEAIVVERSLNDLPSISPSKVKVTRDGPMRTPSTQVFGYIWSITFDSNKWVDPTTNHDTYIDGNWMGPATTFADVWGTGYSRAWGKNVGNVPAIGCSAGSLSVTNGNLPNQGCLVEEVVPGTPPLSGSFTLTLDTTDHPVINIQGVETTTSIAHNAYANATESGGDGSSMQEKLEALPNIGDIIVTRSDVNKNNGGYTWFVTFLRDGSEVGGQWGDDCEQRDSISNLCNSPGNVPSLTYSLSSLTGMCLDDTTEASYACPLITILTGDSEPTDEPPGSKSVQRIYLDNIDYDATFQDRSFMITYYGLKSAPIVGGVSTDCISVDATADIVRTYLSDNITALSNSTGSRGVYVTEGTDTANARNGKVFTFYFFDEGEHLPINATECASPLPAITWSVTPEVVVNGSIFHMTALQAGVKNGIVQRGLLTQFYVTGDTPTPSPTTLLTWNTLPEGRSVLSNVSIKSYLESISDRQVNVTRKVIGKYGVIEYRIQFVYNPGQFPPGAGNVPLLHVVQGPASDGEVYPPQVFELTQGSTGISGYFQVDLNDPNGPRNMSFDESATRLRRKLEEMTTIGGVEVHRFEFPTAGAGGWGANGVAPGTLGGYEWRVYFLRNTGAKDGFSFPPGSGNIDPLTITYVAGVSLFGSDVRAQSIKYVDGSTPIDGSFTLELNGAKTDFIQYDQQPLATKYLLESLPTIGEVSTASEYRLMEKIEGVTVSVSRDSGVLSVHYDTTDAVNPPDITQMLAAGDLIRIGGTDASGVNSQTAIDGAEFYSTLEVVSQSPIVTSRDANAAMLLPGEMLRLGADNYAVVKTGAEVQVISVECASSNSSCGGFHLTFTHNQITDVPSLCINRDEGEVMTSAADLSESLNGLANIGDNNVLVTRASNSDNTSYVFSVYFVGDNVLGDNNELKVVDGCVASVPVVGSVTTLSSGSSVSVFTAVQGGYTEQQTIRVNVDDGYISGGLFKLQAQSYYSMVANTTDNCIDFGAEPSVVAAELNAIESLSQQPLPFQIRATSLSGSEYRLNTTSSAFGIIEVGSVLSVPYDRTGRLTVTSILSPTSFTAASDSVTLQLDTSYDVRLVISNAVQVARYGTGNSTSTVLRIVQTADEYVYPGAAGGYFRLRMIMNGVEKKTATCLQYHSTAEEVQAAINSLQFDFNGDTTYTSSDDDHVEVTRSGDGSSTSGFGYSYYLRFAGPTLEYGRSEVLGKSVPFVEVIGEGEFGGCNDLEGATTDAIYINYKLSNSSTTWFTANINGVQQSTLSYLQAGDRIRLPGSAAPSKTFTVLSADQYSITVDVPLPNSPIPTPSTLRVYVIHSAMPEYSVETLQIGEDSYRYEVFFTGPHLSNMPQMVPVVCAASGFQHFGGMRHGVQVQTTQTGGSDELQQIVLSSRYVVASNDGSKYWKLVRNGVEATRGLEWGATVSEVASALSSDLHVDTVISRTGFGTAQEDYGYAYTVEFNNVGSNGDYPQLIALVDGGVSPAVFVPFNASSFQDDLTTSGQYNGTADGFFTVTVVADKMFTWTLNSVTSSPMSIVAKEEYLLIDNVYVSFGHANGHIVGDAWNFAAVRTTDVLPEGASVTTYLVSSGTPDIDQITLDTGYAGADTGSVTAYLVPPVYFVQDQTVDEYKLVLNNVLGLNNVQYSFTIEAHSSELSETIDTVCVDWDASDLAVEEALTVALANLCGEDECVTVTRSVDDVNNLNGYVYSIYMEHPIFHQEGFTYTIDAHQQVCTANATSTLTFNKTVSSIQHTPFTTTQIPLASRAVSSLAAKFLGKSVSRVPIYKVNGNYWAVTFNTNLGDVNSLVAAPTKYLTEATKLTVYDDVVDGVHPLSHIITGLSTGIEYSARVSAYTRGTYHGYSPFFVSKSGTAANDYSDIPAGKPPAVVGFKATETLKVSEVQSVIVAGAHRNEIQTITTSATEYAEVQQITLTSPEGSVVDGNFTLRFPEVQVFQTRAANTAATANKFFSLQYSQGNLLAPTVTETTICLSLSASAAEVKNALEALTTIDTVEVVRSGYGGYRDYFGYQWSISFTGNNVAGNVNQLVALYGTSGSCAAAPPSSGVTFHMSTLNEDRAVGLDTEIQTVHVQAESSFVEGSYTLTYGGYETSCLAWNASAAEMTAALESLVIIDEVLVERSGAGTSSSGYGYLYSVFFTGNALHPRSVSSPAPLPDLVVNLTNNNCIELAYFKEGTKQPFSPTEATITATRVRARGFNLDTFGTTAEVLDERLLSMPTFVDVYDVRRTLSDDRRGFKWTIVYDVSMGNAPTLVCGQDSTLQSSNGICTHSTVTEGNHIGGYFIVGTSKLFPSDVSAVDMQNELQLLHGFGNVSVSRSNADHQGGYTWTVTWLTIQGDVPPLEFSNSLTGSNATVTGQTLVDGNYLGGSFLLEYDGRVTSSIAYNAPASAVQTALQAIVGSVTVTRSLSNSEGGATYTVTFNALGGDIPNLVPIYSASTLTGAGAVVKVIENVKGSLALGNSLKLSFESPLQCSHSEVVYGSCGSPVTSYTIKVGDSRENIAQVIKIPADYSTQLIRVQATSMYDTLFFLGEDATGFFKLVYNGHSTAPISSHAGAQDMRDALEALPDVNTVSVERSYSAERMNGTVVATPGAQFLTCVGQCTFSVLPPGELIRVGGLWYRVAYTYTGSANRLPLAMYNDSSVLTSYGGAEDDAAPIYRWARGFEWTVRFLSVNTDTVTPLSSPKLGMNPQDAALSIRPADCVDCHYVTGLSALTTYHLTIQAENDKGLGPSTPTVGTPKEIPGPPNAVSVSSISGTQLEVTFSPPSGVISDITQYTIEWDTNPDFTNVNTASNAPSCSTAGYGRCELKGAVLAVTPPYKYLINYLTEGTRYYVRVAARNSVSLLTAATDPANDPTRWSQTVSAVTSNQVPSSPVSVTATVSGPTSLQILITPPISNGGRNLTFYFVEWDASKNFDDVTSYGSYLWDPSDLPVLSSASGILVVDITGLSTGVSYWVRVSARNSIGYGPVTITPKSATPAGKPNQPTSLALVTASAAASSITSTEVTWSAPTGAIPDGGSPITGYLVEWWEGGSVPEVQVIQFTATSFPTPNNGQFRLSFGPEPNVKESTSAFLYTASGYNVRSELMNLGYDSGLTNNFEFSNVIGDVRVSRSVIPNKGYQWSVTFVSETNAGDQVSLVGTPIAALDEFVEVIEVTPGQRAGGFSEVQIISILTSGTNDTSDLGGWFTLSFKSSELLTTYLQVDSSASEVQQALNQLNNSRTVEVTRSEVHVLESGVLYAGYRWTVVFSEDIGNQPAIMLYDTLLFTKATALFVDVYDGDNALNSNGVKIENTFPGEAPQNYKSQVVGADQRAYTINGLVPGITYYVSVSAINAYGNGRATTPGSDYTTPPKQVPQPPTNVGVDVHPGSASTLDVTFGAPLSNGGSDIISYRIELDITPQFTNPIFDIIPCNAGSTYSVFQIKTQGYPNDPIVRGTFGLTISRNRTSFLTDFIPYDAAATLADEEALYPSLVSGIVVTITNNHATVTTSSDPREKVFENDRLIFTGQLYEQELFTVTAVGTTTITLNKPVLLTTGGATTFPSAIKRVIGGRGSTSTSKIACTADAANTLCGPARRRISGSMQAKIESIPEAVIKGVSVDRDEPDITNGVTWRVTFLDDAQLGALNFDIEETLNTNTLITQSGARAIVTVSNLLDGVTYPVCEGTHEVPAAKALANGQYYYARVFALNDIGYSLPQMSATSQKPFVVPGAPTSVILSVDTQTSLRVEFNPPADDGGDTITLYKIDYSTSSSFATFSSINVTQFVTAPFSRIITGLQTGVRVYVRVSAMNNQGFGDSASSVPTSLNPYKPSDAPTQVFLRSTSDTMLTVSFAAPRDDGGDDIVRYRIDWDITPTFNGAVGAPNKGTVQVDATRHSSYTIQYLTKGKVYYVRVFAINSAGPGTPALSSPASLAPSLQVPGKPHTIAATTGAIAGRINLSWIRPRVPAHGIPCSGLTTAPNDCPSGIGGGVAQSDGGSVITEYEIQYNDLPDFTGFDTDKVTTTQNSYTLQNLTPDRLYYIRILARNAQGAGSFCLYSDPNCLVVFNQVSVKAKAL